MVKILYFAWVREAVGVGEEMVAVSADIGTVGDLAAALAARSAGHATAFADMSRLRAAVDATLAGFDASIAGASEVAFFPPVTGG